MAHLIYFISIYFQTLAVIAILGVSGYFLISPFSQRDNLIIFASPLAGMMLIGLGCAVFYGAIGVPFKYALIITLIIGIGLSYAAAFKNAKPEIPEHFYFGLKVFLMLVAVVDYYANYHSIHYLQNTLVLMDGSDQLGYANVVAWLLDHTMRHPPLVSPNHIFQSWPDFAVTGDRRFGTYYFYTAILWLKQTPAQYIYDFVMGIALSVGTMGVIGMYARKPGNVILLSIALIVSTLLGYGYSGYLGKITGYLSLLFVAGLTLNIILHVDYLKENGTIKLLHLFLLTFGMSTLYPGNPITFIFIGTVFFAAFLKTLDEWIFNSENRWQFSGLKLAFLITAFPIMFVGALSVPQILVAESAQVSAVYWDKVIPVSYGFMSFDTIQSYFSNKVVYRLVYLLVAGCFFTALFSLKKRNYLAFAYLFFPLAWLVGALSKHNMAFYYITYQIVGLPYLLAAFAFVTLLEETELNKLARKLIIALFILMIVGGSGYFIKMQKRYVDHRHTPIQRVFVQSQVQTLTQTLHGESVVIDTHDPLSIFLMMEYTKNAETNVFWTHRAWASVMGYRPWHPPKIVGHPHWFIEAHGDIPPQDEECELRFKTNQFDLYYCE